MMPIDSSTVSKSYLLHHELCNGAHSLTLLVGFHACQVVVELGRVHDRDASVKSGHLAKLRLPVVVVISFRVVRVMLVVTEVKQRGNLGGLRHARRFNQHVVEELLLREGNDLVDEITLQCATSRWKVDETGARLSMHFSSEVVHPQWKHLSTNAEGKIFILGYLPSKVFN